MAFIRHRFLQADALSEGEPNADAVQRRSGVPGEGALVRGQRVMLDFVVARLHIGDVSCRAWQYIYGVGPATFLRTTATCRA